MPAAVNATIAWSRKKGEYVAYVSTHIDGGIVLRVEHCEADEAAYFEVSK